MQKPCARALLFFCVIASFAGHAHGQVLAVADTFTVSGRTVLNLSANDAWPSGDDVDIEVTMPPMHGVIRALSDGRVAYEPDADPAVPDHFTYRLVSRPLHTVQLVPETSMLDFGADVSTPLGSASDTEVIGVAGTAGVHIWAGGDSVRVATLAIRNVADVGLRFDYGSPVVFATLRVRAAADSISLSQTSPAAPAARAGLFGSFAHAAVPFDIVAAVTLEGTGLFTGQVPDGIQRLETAAERAYAGSTIFSGDTVLLTLDVAFTESFPLADNTVALTISGSLQGTGPARPVETSADVEVTIRPVTDTSVERPAAPDRRSMSVYPNPARVHATIDGLSPHGTWVLVDMLGRTVRSGAGLEVSLVGLSHGVYSVRTSHGATALTILP